MAEPYPESETQDDGQEILPDVEPVIDPRDEDPEGDED